MTISTLSNSINPRWAVALFIVFLGATAGAIDVRAQADDLYAPPPSQALSKDERAKLDEKASPKDRTKLTLEMMDVRLTSAEKLTAEKNFKQAYSELGIFHGLVADLVGFLERSHSRGKKVFDEFKRMEMALRRYGSRVEGVRREMPFEFDEYVKNLLEIVRSARSRAVDHFFGDTVTSNK